jgi:hypothetical protein
MWDDERRERLIKEVWYFMRYGPAVGRKQIAMGNVEFQEWLVLKPGFASDQSGEASDGFPAHAVVG